MSQKALFINSIHIKQKFIKSFEKVKSCEPKKSKNRKFSWFSSYKTVQNFRLGDENFLKKLRSHVSESTFYQFYSHKTNIYKKFWKSEKLLANKVEKSEIFTICLLKKYRFLTLDMEIFEKIMSPRLKKLFSLILIN